MFARWLAVSLGFCSLAPSAVRACGGGLFSEGNVTGNVQRIVLSVRDGGARTDVITQVEVKETTDNYALLIPLPVEPTLDPMPVDSAELATLDEQTRVILEHPSGSSGKSGCGTGPKNKSTPIRQPGGDLDVGAPVTIGPVTAVALSADTGEAIVAWLENNDFVLRHGSAEVIGEYAGPGRWFLAVKRSDTKLGGPTSIGIHFTLAGDQRTLSLPFSRFGAPAQLSFVVFVAAERAAGPRPPFRVLTLDDLDPELVAESYGGAIASAVAAEDNRAFVVEGVYEDALRSALQGTRLGEMIDGTAVVTRLTGIFIRTSLDHEVSFTGDVPDDVPTTLDVSASLDTSWPLDGRFAWLLVSFAVLGSARTGRARAVQRAITSS